MRPDPRDGATRASDKNSGFPVRLSAFYAALFVLVGVVTPFFPVFLAARGLDAQEIGIVLAVPLLMRMAAIPVATRVADRRGAVRQTLVLLCWATAAGYAATALPHSFAGLLTAVTITAALYAPVMALADAYAIQRLKESGRAYGPVRLWGSFSFIAANIGAGLMLDFVSAQYLIALIAAAAAATGIAAMALRPIATGAVPAGRKDSALDLMKQPAFAAVIVAASLVQASHAVYNGFSTIAWTDAGFDGLTIGALWAIGVIAEIVLFATSGRFPPAIGPLALLLFGATGAALRWTVMAFDPPAPALPFLQCLHGLSFGATHLGLVGFVAQTAPQRLGATAQGLFHVVNAPMMAAMLGASGFLYAAYGAGAYAAMAVASALGGVLLLWARQTHQRTSSSSS
jgi:PPP family 3-phenylpropionic acid transporter